MTRSFAPTRCMRQVSVTDKAVMTCCLIVSDVADDDVMFLRGVARRWVMTWRVLLIHIKGVSVCMWL